MCGLFFQGRRELPSSPPPSAATPPPSFVFGLSFLLSFLSRSSRIAIPPSPDSFIPPRRRPLVVFHPQIACCSWFFGESQIRSFSSQICRPLLLQRIDTPHHRAIQLPSFPLLPPSFCSVHHSPTCVLQTLARSSIASLPSSCPLLKLLLSGPFYYVIFIFYVFFFCLCFASLFVICCFCVWWVTASPAFWCSDLRVENFVTGFVLVPLLFSIPVSDYDSASSASASYQWLLLLPSGERIMSFA